MKLLTSKQWNVCGVLVLIPFLCGFISVNQSEEIQSDDKNWVVEATPEPTSSGYSARQVVSASEDIGEMNKHEFAHQVAEQLMAKIGSRADLGIKVQSLSGDVLYSKNEYQTFVPASNVKIFTAVAAMLSLGGNYTFDTQLLTSAPVYSLHKGILNGDVYIKFSGDPDLSQQDIAQLVAELKKNGIQQINGHVYVDDSAFDGRMLGPGWSGSDAKYCYSAPVSSVIVDRNCVKMQRSPKKAVHDQCYTTVSHRKHHKTSKRFCKRSRATAYLVQSVLHDPTSYGVRLVAEIFAQQNIAYNGDVQVAAAPKSARILALHRSPPLTQLLMTMLKESNNLFADAIFKKIGSVYYREPGNWNNGAQAVRRILAEKAHLDVKQLHLVDGSGMSRNNMVTPDNIVDLLKFAYHELPGAANFITALPIAGIDGTLAKRMRNTHCKGRVHAKTGTMHSVSALSGYIETTHHDILIFSIIINGYAGSGYYYRHIADELIAKSAKNF